MSAKISVIIPIYNTAEYLPKCLDSILAQKFQDFEVICVNDGSSDGSLRILEEYALKSEKIRIITQKNKGIAAARNTGLDNAKGKYVQFVDSDDWLSLDLLEETYNLAETKNADMVCFNVASYDEKIKTVKADIFFPPSFWLRNVNGADIYTYKNYANIFHGNFSCVNKLYKREFLQKNGIKFIENIKFEDHPFHLESMLAAKNIALINYSLYYYRINLKNSFMSRMKKNRDIMDILETMKIHKKILMKFGVYEELKEKFIFFTACLLIKMYLYEVPYFLKPEFYAEMKKIYEENNDGERLPKMILNSNICEYYTDVAVCNWWNFQLKYGILDAGKNIKG